MNAPKINQKTTGEASEYLSYVNKFGHALIDSVNLKIGGYVIDTQYGEFLDIWNELTVPSEKQEGYNAMTGIYETEMDLENNNLARTYYIPLQFFFCQHPGLSLPLIALQYHEVQIEFKLRPFREMLCCHESATVDQLLSNGYDIESEEFDVSLFVDYIYLDVDERRRMAQSAHEMLITQTKKISHVMGNGVSTGKIDLKNLNHPIKEIIWVAKQNDQQTTEPKDYFRYFYNSSNGGHAAVMTVHNYQHTIHSINPQEIMKSASLTLNGTERVDKRDNLFYRFIQPYQHHTRIPMDYIYLYSFALKPEEIQPSGSCNFSRVDNAYLNVENYSEVSGNIEYTVYALNWNVFRIQAGMGGIAFTN